MFLPLSIAPREPIVVLYMYLCTPAFCTGLEVPEQALGGIPLGLELVVKINLTLYMYMYMYMYSTYVKVESINL